MAVSLRAPCMPAALVLFFAVPVFLVWWGMVSGLVGVCGVCGGKL